MALPYVTEIEARKIAKQEIKESGSQPQPGPEPQPTNKYPMIDYTLDELLAYVDVPQEELPSDLKDAINYCLNTMHLEDEYCSYAEFYTKDGYCFKGSLCISSGLQGGHVALSCWISQYEITEVEMSLGADAETGDLYLELNAIHYEHLY